MSQAPQPHDSEPDDVAKPEETAAIPDGARPRGGEVTKTRKWLWVIGAGLGLYLIGNGLLEMLVSSG